MGHSVWQFYGNNCGQKIGKRRPLLSIDNDVTKNSDQHLGLTGTVVKMIWNKQNSKTSLGQFQTLQFRQRIQTRCSCLVSRKMVSIEDGNLTQDTSFLNFAQVSNQIIQLKIVEIYKRPWFIRCIHQE